MKRSISTLLVRTVLVGLLAGISPHAIAGQNVPETDPPGSLEAIEAATSIAAEKAAVEVMRGIPPGLDIIAVLPFLGDSEGMTTVTFEAALTTAARSRGIRLITRGSDEWSRIGAPVLDRSGVDRRPLVHACGTLWRGSRSRHRHRACSFSAKNCPRTEIKRPQKLSD